MTIYVLRTANRAAVSKSTYTFSGANTSFTWPIECGSGLGFAGAWNLVWRLGFKPRPVTISDLAACQRRKNEASVLIAPECDGDHNTIRAIREWSHMGGYAVTAGDPHGLLPGGINIETAFADPVAPLAFEGVLPERILVAPPRWPVYRFPSGASSVSNYGHVSRVRGAAETPELAVLERIQNASAVLVHSNVAYLNANPFTALQAWLQGQECTQRWLRWRDPLFWIDEMVAGLHRVLKRAGVPWRNIGRSAPWPSSGTTVCIRHDLDSSRDTSYLEENHRRGIPATHAVLRDQNTAYWLNRLHRVPLQQTSFHYNTVAVSLRTRLSQRLSHRLPGFMSAPRRIPIATPSRAELSAGGLAIQLDWAKRNGVPVETVCRHFSFVLYPEIIAELDHAAKRHPELIGDSTFFRGQFHRWGANGVDGMRGTISVETGTPFSLWYPYRIAHAADGGRLLPIWELTCVIEPDIEVVEHLLRHRIPELPDRVISLCFHPAHAQQPNFGPKGSLLLYRAILDLFQQRNTTILTERTLFSQASDRATV